MTVPARTRPLPPGSTIGIIGGGQLGRMMATAAAHMGYHVHIYTPEENSPASEVARTTTVAAYEDLTALAAFASSVDVVTYEFENIPAAPVATLVERVGVYPPPALLAVSQHRVQEKQAINALDVPTAPFLPVASLEQLYSAVQQLGLPCVLKTCRFGYDGKGQFMLKTEADIETAWNTLKSDDLILEGFVDFRMEISVIVARDDEGNVEYYCPVQNIHKHHILSETIAPAPIFPALAQEAERIAYTLAHGLKLVGLMAVEMFVTSDDRIVVNEIAPRPHNSGHWTMDACITSQFEQAIRAAAGLPLGDPSRLCNARMLNLIGDDINDWLTHVNTPRAKLHMYGKSEARPGRKMGHVNFLNPAKV
jgi:5-(carboxyamino)imidazole ribonucleotide synthase